MTANLSFLSAFVTVGTLSLTTSFAAVELLTNGNFETGNFTGWSSSVSSGSNGNRFIDNPGTSVPLSGAATVANPGGGSYYAVTDQSGPGAYAMSQTFIIPTVPAAVILTFQMFNQSSANLSVNPAGLTQSASPNQHARVDILTGTAGDFDTGAGVLQNLYLGKDPTNPNPYISYSFNIKSIVSTPGTYKLRFGQVDNQGIFQQGVDNVSIQFTAIPESSAVALGGITLIGFLRRRRQPHK